MNIFKIISFSLILFIFVADIKAQCDESLTEKAITESGDKALFIKDFKVKLKKGKIKRPERVAKFLITLKSNTNYRFNVVNDNNYQGRVILQLFKKDKFLGCTYDFNNKKNNKSFDFQCIESDTYQVLMSFIEGKAGCAAGSEIP